MKQLVFYLILTQSIFLSSQEMFKIEYTILYKNGTGFPCELYTNNKEAVFIIKDTRESGLFDLPNGDVEKVENDELSNFFYTNNDLAYNRIIARDKEILYSDKYNEKINWQIKAEETKKIGKYNCTKAEMKLNGRNYVAWFTFDVPINFGPLKLHKLPGMLVELECDKNFIKFRLESVSKTKDLKTFNFRKNYFLKSKSVITFDAYGKKIIDLENSIRRQGQAMMKKMNLENGTHSKLSFEDDVTADSYLDLPSNFWSEMRKTNGK